MKNYIWGILGVIVIALVVVFSKGHKTDAPTTETPAATTATGTTITSSTDTTSMNTNDDTTHVRADGLGITIVKAGSGAAAKNGDKVTVNYTGKFENGISFDSNVDPKFNHVQPFTFVLGAGMVIKGWDDGVLGMQVGETRHLSIPSALAYGVYGQGTIPPNTDLEFDVTVVGISH